MSDPRDEDLSPNAGHPLHPPPAQGRNAADPELREAEDRTRDLPARYANRLYAAPDGHNVRLVFGERIGDGTIFHTALIVSAGDGLLMARLIAEIAGATVDWQIENAPDHLQALKDLRAADPP
ncbi:MAG TPA: hypothetical protein VF782_09275 [Allosphingosinicella sp.]